MKTVRRDWHLKAAESYLEAACKREGVSGSMPHSPKDRQVPHAQGWYTFEAIVFKV